jgi:hypothetical protein
MSNRTVHLRESPKDMPADTKTRIVDLRESLYLLSIEVVIFYVLAFGLLALKTDNMFSAGIAYAAVLWTSLLAFLLPVVAVLVVMLGFERAHTAAMTAARGAAVFSCVAFLLFLVLTTALWSSPLICVYVNDTSTQCGQKGDAVWQDTDAADVRFVFPSRAQYSEHVELANASVADIFMKTSLSENDYVTRLHAVLAVPVAFIILVLQSSFFYAVYCVEASEATTSDVFTAADVMRLFVRCALLLLCVVIDTADLFSAWNVVDVGPQMMPSLAFASLLFCTDFGETILENAIDTWTPDEEHERLKYQLGLLAFICAVALAAGYTIFALVVACHYLVGGFAEMHDFIADTRLSTVNLLFVAFLLLDACSTLVRSAFKIHNRYVAKDEHRKKEQKLKVNAAADTVALPDELAADIQLKTTINPKKDA